MRRGLNSFQHQQVAEFIGGQGRPPFKEQIGNLFMHGLAAVLVVLISNGTLLTKFKYSPLVL